MIKKGGVKTGRYIGKEKPAKVLEQQEGALSAGVGSSEILEDL